MIMPIILTPNTKRLITPHCEELELLPWMQHPIIIRYEPVDHFFDDGNKACGIFTKEFVKEIEREEYCHKSYSKFFCTESGCSEEFENLISYESHYNSIHRNVCSACRKVLPSTHLLEIHMTEMHDSYFSAMIDKEYKKLFECLVDNCGQKFDTPNQRKDHLSKDHFYPRNFKYLNFFRKSLNEDKMFVEDVKLKKSKSNLPKVVSFGSGASRSFVRSKTFKPWNQNLKGSKATNKNIEKLSTKDLKDALMDEN